MRKTKLLLGALTAAFALNADAVVSVPMAQLPYTNPQQVRSMLQDLDRKFSWDKTRRLIEKYVPPEIDVIGHPRGWLSNRTVCYENRTAAHCRAALSQILYTMELKEELGWTRMRIITFEQIPYSDPAPLDAIIATLDYGNGPPAMTHEQATAALEPYLAPTLIVDAPAESSFNFNRAQCLYGQYANLPNPAPYFVYCHAYAVELSAILRENMSRQRAVSANPFSR
ncbi:MAG TPA: hypothetical protein VM406_15840 [Noviherbaspirillum sp.]|nr:hypothetical protein [Noviherbaspirillum sp.]